MKILFFQKTYNSEISKIILTIRIYINKKKGVAYRATPYFKVTEKK